MGCRGWGPTRPRPTPPPLRRPRLLRRWRPPRLRRPPPCYSSTLTRTSLAEAEAEAAVSAGPMLLLHLLLSRFNNSHLHSIKFLLLMAAEMQPQLKTTVYLQEILLSSKSNNPTSRNLKRTSKSSPTDSPLSDDEIGWIEGTLN